jgi:hypothetical protein
VIKVMDSVDISISKSKEYLKAISFTKIHTNKVGLFIKMVVIM